MTRCDKCRQPATKLVSSSDALGGNPMSGSFRSFRCDACADEVVKQLIARRNNWAVQPLARESREPVLEYSDDSWMRTQRLFASRHG